MFNIKKTVTVFIGPSLYARSKRLAQNIYGIDFFSVTDKGATKRARLSAPKRYPASVPTAKQRTRPQTPSKNNPPARKEGLLLRHRLPVNAFFVYGSLDKRHERPTPGRGRETFKQ